MEQIALERTVAAPVAAVWEAWTTTEGARTFFAPEANIELRVGGPYELYFDLEAEIGEMGSEGCCVMAFVPERVLTFTWNAPPHLAEVRLQRTWVTVVFTDMGGQTRVELYQLGWGEGPQWDETHAYFERAWPMVLDALVERFA